MAEFIRVNHIALTVRDLAKSTAWYSDFLGLEKVGELPGESGRGAVLVFRDPDNIQLEMYLPK
ncbi:MAG: VOC family protein [Chloroflexota bacterium]